VSDTALATLLSNPVSAIATLGATATGLSIYAGVENSIWLYKKVTMALSKPDGTPTSIDKPGQPGDDEEKDPLEMWLVSYVVSASPAEYGLFSAVFDAVPSRTLDQARFAIFQQGRGRYGSTSQIAQCDDNVLITGPIPGVIACIVNIKPLAASASIDEWIPYLVTTNQWRYVNPETGTMYNTGNYQLASAALAGLPDIFSRMSPEAQFYWQAMNAIPTNYLPWQTNKRLATFQLNQSNDCRIAISLLDSCYEQAVSP
jgi:hypothetical protein